MDGKVCPENFLTLLQDFRKLFKCQKSVGFLLLYLQN